MMLFALNSELYSLNRLKFMWVDKILLSKKKWQYPTKADSTERPARGVYATYGNEEVN